MGRRWSVFCKSCDFRVRHSDAESMNDPRADRFSRMWQPHDPVPKRTVYHLCRSQPWGNERRKRFIECCTEWKVNVVMWTEREFTFKPGWKRVVRCVTKSVPCDTAQPSCRLHPRCFGRTFFGGLRILARLVFAFPRICAAKILYEINVLRQNDIYSISNLPISRDSVCSKFLADEEPILAKKFIFSRLWIPLRLFSWFVRLCTNFQWHFACHIVSSLFDLTNHIWMLWLLCVTHSLLYAACERGSTVDG